MLLALATLFTLGCMSPSDPRHRSCEEVRDYLSDNKMKLADGAYYLFLAGDGSQPFEAWCDDLAGSPTEWLDVNAFSRFVSGDRVVETVHERLRFHPEDATIDPLDGEFASTDNDDGLELPTGGDHIPAGWALHEANPSEEVPSSPAVTFVDLAGTGFVFADEVRDAPDDFFCRFDDAHPDGGPPGDALVLDPGGARFTLTADAKEGTVVVVADCEHTVSRTAERGVWPLVYVGE